MYRRFYTYDSEFAEHRVTQNLDEDIAGTLRAHIHGNIRWAQDYRSAVDSVLHGPGVDDLNSPPPYIAFADVSRTNDGPVLGEQMSTP